MRWLRLWSWLPHRLRSTREIESTGVGSCVEIFVDRFEHAVVIRVLGVATVSLYGVLLLQHGRVVVRSEIEIAMRIGIVCVVLRHVAFAGVETLAIFFMTAPQPTAVRTTIMAAMPEELATTSSVRGTAAALVTTGVTFA